jgi:hypothetical protein
MFYCRVTLVFQLLLKHVKATKQEKNFLKKHVSKCNNLLYNMYYYNYTGRAPSGDYSFSVFKNNFLFFYYTKTISDSW